MRRLLTAAAAVVALGMLTAPAVARHWPVPPPGQEKPWQPKPPKLEKQLQKLAAELCIAAVGSGAYADLNDDDLSDLCKNTAEHILKDPYDHVVEPD